MLSQRGSHCTITNRPFGKSILGANDWETTRGAHNPPKSPKIRSSPLKWKFQMAYRMVLSGCLFMHRSARRSRGGRAWARARASTKERSEKASISKTRPVQLFKRKKNAPCAYSQCHMSMRENAIATVIGFFLQTARRSTAENMGLTSVFVSVGHADGYTGEGGWRGRSH